MRPSLHLVTAAALAVVVAGGVPALAHAPRDARPGGPRMDVEVQVTPPLATSVTPGGRDASLSVDGFGNRFAVARKEVLAGVVSPDPRARTMARTGAWQWTSDDEGATWTNLDLLPRGADALLPERADRDVTSSGTRTWVAETGPAGAVVVAVTATGRGRLVAGLPAVVPVVPAAGSRPALAAAGSTVVLVTRAVTGGSQVSTSLDGGASWGRPSPLAGTACDAAGAGRLLAVVCLESSTVVLHTSRDGGPYDTRALGPADVRGGDGGLPSVDIGPDGVPTVLTGLLVHRVGPRGATRQDLTGERGTYRTTTLAVSGRGRLGVAAYRLLPGDRGWNVVITVLSPGARPVWADFAAHEPAGRSAAAGPPSDRLSVDFDPLGQVHLLWTATRLHSAELDAPLLRNVWSVRSTST